MTTTAPASTPVSSLAAGQTVRCTVLREPRAEGAVKTIERLMRRDPAAVRGLRRAQELRERRKNRYVRGNRWWVAREKPARIVRVAPGKTWTMPFTFDIAPDLSSVADYLSIERA